jgi:hypothetical protein
VNKNKKTKTNNKAQHNTTLVLLISPPFFFWQFQEDIEYCLVSHRHKLGGWQLLSFGAEIIKSKLIPKPRRNKKITG